MKSLASRALHIQALRLALSLLTTIPVGKQKIDDAHLTQARILSCSYYPVVGFVLASCLAIIFTLFHYLLSNTTTSFLTPLIAAVLLLTCWVGLTGALHIDGFADSVDALAASHKQKDTEKTLAIFKDPRSGPMAICVIVILLLLKVSILHSLLSTLSYKNAWLFFPVCILPRVFAVLYMKHTPYARANGLASGLHTHDTLLLFYMLTFIFFIALYSLTSISAYTLVLSSIMCITVLFLWRHIWLKHIGGFTGDTVGAYIELAETSVLLTIII